FHRLQEPALNEELARLTKQIEAAPENAIAYYERGLFYARLGRWRQCADDFWHRARLKPDDRLMWGPASSAVALAGDEAKYRQFCGEMLDRFRGAVQADIADTVCKSSVLLPGVVPLSDLPVQALSDGAADPNWATGYDYHPWFHACLALVTIARAN